MTLPPRFRSDLWRRLGEAQDLTADATNDACLRQVERGVVARLAVCRGEVGWARRLAKWRLALGAGLVAAVAAAAVLIPPRVLERRIVDTSALAVSGVSTVSERAFVADARSDLPLHFADGSSVVFRAGSAGRMQRFTGAGAEIVLERGSLEAHVIHTATTLWLVHAGPFRVRVTGTRFAVTWAAAAFELDLYEGSVTIDGAVLGAGVPLRAGQRLKIASGVVTIEPLGARNSMAMAEPAGAVAGTSVAVAGSSMSEVVAAIGDAPGSEPRPRVSSPGAGDRSGEKKWGARPTGLRAVRAAGWPGAAVTDDEWLALVERGEYREALVSAKRLGWGGLCRRLDARRLLTLGDVARFAGARAEAKQAFQALVHRFPDDRLAADAVFSLGRLEFEASHPREATRWFRRYVSAWPAAPLADQAAGRLLECAIRVEDHEGARIAARRYLARAPSGPHATLARQILEQAVHGQP